ncbi:hypothetical protein MMC26_004734 [Xylographa opegraphella]|nr:hypothetical protein [Xylographa opegraphella]
MDSKIHYTVFIRVPTPRGDFIDPPAVQWDASKDKALWKILSSPSKDTEIDWNMLADRFEVTLSFLLQQAAWLYERQLSQVREQLRRVNKPASARSSPAPESASASTQVGGYVMKRGGSGDISVMVYFLNFWADVSQGSRVPSSLSVRPRDTPNTRNEVAETPEQNKGPVSTRPGTGNIGAQSQKAIPQTSTGHPSRNLEGSFRQEIASSPRQGNDIQGLRFPSPKADSSPESSSSSDPPPLAHSRAFTRRPQFPGGKSKAKINVGLLSSPDEEDDELDDDGPAFLPFSNANPIETPQSPQDPSATLRRLPSNTSRKENRPDPIETVAANRTSAATSRLLSQTTTRAQPQMIMKTAHSSSSSLSSPFPTSNAQSKTLSSPNPGPTSPTGPMSALSPRTRRMAREGSEETPSMGSSFSDLDDTSITQSALEEQMAREIREAGSLGVVSRMGGLWKGRGGGRFAA